MDCYTAWWLINFSDEICKVIFAFINLFGIMASYCSFDKFIIFPLKASKLSCEFWACFIMAWIYIDTTHLYVLIEQKRKYFPLRLLFCHLSKEKKKEREYGENSTTSHHFSAAFHHMFSRANFTWLLHSLILHATVSCLKRIQHGLSSP